MSAAPQRKPVEQATAATTSFSWKKWELKDGEWFVNPKAVVEHLERDCHTENERVLGYLIRHSLAYQTELVVKAVSKKDAKGRVIANWSRDGEYALVRVTPIDIAKDLGMNRHNVNRALKDFKRNGQIEQEGRVARKSFLKVLIWPKDPKDVINPDSFSDSSPLPLPELIEEFNISLSQSIRKKFFPHMDGTLDLHSELVINPDYRKKVVESAPKVWDRVAPTVKEVWQREWKAELEQIAKEFENDNRSGVRSEQAYKEERILERKQVKEQYSTEGSGRSVVPENPPAPHASHPSDQKPPITETRSFLQQFSKLLGKVPDPAIIRSVAEARGESSLEQLIALVRSRIAEGLKIRSFGIFLDFAKECARSCQEWNRAPEGAALTAAAGAGISKNARVIQMYIEQELKERKLK